MGYARERTPLFGWVHKFVEWQPTRFIKRRQMRRARRFTLCRTKSRTTAGLSKSTLAPVRGTIPAWPAGCSPSAEYAGKCNAPGCTKVTKCHLPKATRCAPLQASSRRPVCNYTFLFSFLLSSLFFSSFIISRPPARTYVRTYVRASREPCPASDGAPQPILTRNFQTHRVQTRANASKGAASRTR